MLRPDDDASCGNNSASYCFSLVSLHIGKRKHLLKALATASGQVPNFSLSQKISKMAVLLSVSKDQLPGAGGV